MNGSSNLVYPYPGIPFSNKKEPNYWHYQQHKGIYIVMLTKNHHIPPSPIKTKERGKRSTNSTFPFI